MDTLNERIGRAKGYTYVQIDAHTGRAVGYDASVSLVKRLLLPDWAHDLNAAIRLVDAWFTLECTGSEGWRAMFVYPQTVAYAATPAAAICEAWLEWHETKEKG